MNKRDPNDAVDELLKNRHKYAKAKSERKYLEEFRKSKKAILMKEAMSDGHAAVNAQEREAYSHPEYLELLEGIRQATLIEEELHWLIASAQMRVDIWRTEQANDRIEGRVTL